tara:strand:+ start:1399 stop:2262 length:864 start_codon:yes stop_codon:yes gene_type:complete
VKQYASFITEARTTKASSQAKRLGLVGDGHGDWYDKQGNLKAKTVSGELKMFSGRNAAAPEDESDKSTAAKSGSRHSSGGSVERQSTPSSPAGAEMEKMQKQLQNFSARQEFDAAARSEPLTIAFDKFDNEEISNSIVTATAESANGGQYYIFPSRSADIGKLKETYGESIIDDENAETIYDVLQSIYENGYNAINVIVRKSKVDEISKLALEQNGALYNYVMMNFIPVEETTIRERYLAGDIFKKGQLIESNDRVGVVIRRGSNHLICLDKHKEVFRSWITDSVEI